MLAPARGLPSRQWSGAFHRSRPPSPGPRAVVDTVVMRRSRVIVTLVLGAAIAAPSSAGALAASPPPDRAFPARSTGPSWLWPVPAPRVVRRFEAPATRYSAGHRGIDLSSEPGDPVRSPADATVAFAGTVVDRAVLTLVIGDALVSLEPVATSVAEGERVAEGQELGRVASGGHCGTRCLHVGVRRDGDYVSPLLYLASVERAVLLPLE